MPRGFVFNNIDTSPDPPPDDKIMHLAVHESAWSTVPMADPPAGGVRVMMSSFSEVSSKASRCKAIYSAGQWPLPCLKTFETTETSGPSTQYDAQVASFLATCDTGGVHRGDAFECGNEPYDNATIDQVLRAIAGCYARLRLAGRRVVVPHILGPGYTRVMDRLDSPVAASGNCTWSMVDGFAYHSYQDDETSTMDGLIALRTALDNRGHTGMPIFLTENGWPVDRFSTVNGGSPNDQNIHCATANPGTNWPDAGYTPVQQKNKLNAMYNCLLPGATEYRGKNARKLKIRCWVWFAYADFNPGASNGYNHCGLVEQDTRATAGPPNYQDATNGGGSWVLHSQPYDGRAKGAGTAGPPVDGSGPYGQALAAMRALPDYLDLS